MGSENQKHLLEQTLWVQFLSFIVPEEVLQDGLDPTTRQVLCDLLCGCVVMAIIFLPNFCFKTKYAADLEQMKAAGYHSVDLDFSKEEIQEIRKM